MPSLLRNKKASFNYEIDDRFEAGIELFGYEVKSLRAQQGSLEGAHVVVRGGEAFIVGMTIPPYQQKNTPPSYEPERIRKLLLTKKEIAELSTREAQKGMTVIPLSVHTKARTIKIEIAIARGKKKYDKRESIKKHDTKRDIEREFKHKMR